MLTKDLIINVSTATGLPRKRVEELLGATNATVREALMGGKSIVLQGFGTLEIKQRNERTFANPRTGEKTRVTCKPQLIFKPTATVKEVFNEA